MKIVIKLQIGGPIKNKYNDKGTYYFHKVNRVVRAVLVCTSKRSKKDLTIITSYNILLLTVPMWKHCLTLARNPQQMVLVLDLLLSTNQLGFGQHSVHSLTWTWNHHLWYNCSNGPVKKKFNNHLYHFDLYFIFGVYIYFANLLAYVLYDTPTIKLPSWPEELYQDHNHL